MARAETALAPEAALLDRQARGRIERAIYARVDRIGRFAGNSFLVLGGVVLLGSTGLSIPGVFDGVSGVWRVIAWLILVLALAFGVLSAYRGDSLTDLRGRVHRSASSVASRLLYGQASPPSGRIGLPAKPPRRGLLEDDLGPSTGAGRDARDDGSPPNSSSRPAE